MMLEHFSFSNHLSSLPHTTEQIHMASQILAMAGKYLHTPSVDDSHTNFKWNVAKNRFESHALAKANGVRVLLNPLAWKWQLADQNDDIFDQLTITDRSLEDGILWLKRSLHPYSKDAGLLKVEFHYELPEYASELKKFSQLIPESVRLFCSLRSLSDVVLHQQKLAFTWSSTVRTWPHHFDHGVYIPLSKDDNGSVNKSISLGLAIHDQFIEEHYFYITHWNRDRSSNLAERKALCAGYWTTGDFVGAVLPISSLVELMPDQRKSTIETYFSDGIANSLELIGIQR